MTRTRRLLHVVGDSKFGGGSVLIGRLAGAARAEGWRVTVLTTDRVFQEELRRLHIEVEALDVIRRAVRPVADLAGLVRLTAFLRRRRFDVVHTHTSKAGLIGRLAARAAGVPAIVHTVHGFAFHDFTRPFARKALVSAEQVAARCCDRVVTVSQYHCDVALRYGIGSRERIIAIPNGIQPSRVSQEVGRQGIRASLGVAGGEILLLAVGRLAVQKGFRFAVQATADVRRRGRPVVLAIAGDGEENAALNGLTAQLGLSDHVRLLGFRSDLGNLLAASDVVVLPSLWEGLSLALLEAMAAAKPIVTTRIGSNVEVTGDGRCAVLVPPGSSSALAEGIIDLLDDPDGAATMAARARRAFERHYTEEAMLRRYLTLYSSLLQEKTAYVEAPDPRNVAC